MKSKYTLGLVLLVAALLSQSLSNIERKPVFLIHGVSAEMTKAEVSASSTPFTNVAVTVPMAPGQIEKPYVLLGTDGRINLVVGDQLEFGEDVIRSGESASKLLNSLGHPAKITPVNGAFENWHYDSRLVVRVAPVRKTIIEFVLAGV